MNIDTANAPIQPAANPPALPGPILLLRGAFAVYISRLKAIFSMAALAFVAVLLASIVPDDHPTLSFIAGLLSLVVVYLTYVGFIYACADPQAKTRPYIVYYQMAWASVGMYVWVWFLTFFVIAGAAVFLIVPGIAAIVYLSLATFAVVLEQRRGFDAILKSAEYVRGSWWAVFGRIVFLGIMLVLATLFVSTFFFGHESSWWAEVIVQAVSVFCLVPLSTAYVYLIYRNLRNKFLARPEAKDPDMPHSKKMYQMIVGLAVLGFAAFCALALSGVLGAFFAK